MGGSLRWLQAGGLAEAVVDAGGGGGPESTVPGACRRGPLGMREVSSSASNNGIC